MDRLKDFVIHFVGLSAGEHRFDFDLDQKFFEHFENSQIGNCSLHATVDMNKQERMLVFDISLGGTVQVMCDRCGGEFEHPLSGTSQLIVKFGTSHTEESEDVVVIPESDYKFDLAPYIYEYATLALPVRILHPDDENGNPTCDPDMLQRLNQLTHTTHTDSRWDILRNIDTSK